MATASTFGAKTDHWGYASSDLVLISSSMTPRAMSTAEQHDENDDPVAQTAFGNLAGELFDASCTYHLKSGTLNLNTLSLGEDAVSGGIKDKIDVKTANSAWPEIVVSGQLGTEAVTAPTGKTNAWALPSITINGMKQAQLIDFTLTGETPGFRLTGSGVSASATIAEDTDGEGEPTAHSVSGAKIDLEADFAHVTAVAAWTLGGTWNELQAPGSPEEPQAAYHTSKGTATKLLTRGTAA